MSERTTLVARSGRATLVARRGRATLVALAGFLLAPVPGAVGIASAATTTPAPTPIPVTGCDGSLSYATPTIDDPNLLNYKFHCSGQVTAYTVIVNRPGHYLDEIDDFTTAASVFDPTGNQITTENFACAGLLPGAGVNCNVGTGTSSDPWTNIEGQLDTSDPFCANLPPHAKPGTKPEPGATAQLVVTDATGAEQGPFSLPITPACKPGKAVPKPKPVKHKRVRKVSSKGRTR
jgi:hypothetical protein